MQITIEGRIVLLDEIPKWFKDYRWGINPGGYLKGRKFGDSKSGYLFHRVLLGLEKGDGKLVDHINRNRLDNRKENLRIVTYLENARNKTSIKGEARGVYYHKLRKLWYVNVYCNYKLITAGRTFKTREEAIPAAKALRKKLYGVYAGD